MYQIIKYDKNKKKVLSIIQYFENEVLEIFKELKEGETLQIIKYTKEETEEYKIMSSMD